MQKASVFGQMSEFLSDKIMCKLWGKVTSVSVNVNFGGKKCQFCAKKI